MSAEKDITLDEKRVYGAKRGRSELFVATAVGLVRVSVSGALVGEFGLVHRGSVRDVAAGGDLAVATDEDVLLARAGEGSEGSEGSDGDEEGEPSFEPTGFGPAVAVSTREGVVAGDGERVARLRDGDWETCCELGGVTAIDGGLVAADSGVHRLDGGHVGLSGARDVAASVPLAATDDGLFHLGNGWMRSLDGAFEAVASDGGRAHAAGDRLYAMGADPESWEPVELPVEARVVDVAHGETTYAVTEDGTLLADDGEGGWRERALGLSDARALAVVRGERTSEESGEGD
jgi:hypothetical protein